MASESVRRLKPLDIAAVAPSARQDSGIHQSAVDPLPMVPALLHPLYIAKEGVMGKMTNFSVTPKSWIMPYTGLTSQTVSAILPLGLTRMLWVRF